MCSDDESFILKGAPVNSIPECSLGEYVFRNLKTHPEDNILQVDAESGTTQTSESFLKTCVQLAEGFKNIDMEQNDVVALLVRNCMEAAQVIVATWLNGAVIAPINGLMTVSELQHMLELTKPKFIICEEVMIRNVSEALNILPLNPTILAVTKNQNSTYRPLDDILVEEVDVENFEPAKTDSPSTELVVIMPSSGSSGLSKAVGITHTNLIFQSESLKLAKFLQGVENFLQLSHFFWVTGLMFLLVSICNGMKRIFMQNPTPENFLMACDQCKPDWTMAGPLYLLKVTNHPEFDNYDISTLKKILVGGSPFTPNIGEKLKPKWSHARFIQAYGATEVSGSISCTDESDNVYSVGKVTPGLEVKVVDIDTGKALKANSIGEIRVKSPGTMKCYVGNEEATKETIDESGWYRTGDLGYYDEDEQLYIVDRIKEMVKVMNMQVAPAEIENFILAIPGVVDVGVTGVLKDGIDFYLVGVVVKDENSSLKEEDIHAEIKKNLSEYKYLTGGVYFVDSLPKTGSGKLQRSEMKKMAEALMKIQE